MRRLGLQGAGVVAAFLVVASGAHSFSGQRAGFGVQTPTGYQVSNVKYWLDGGSSVRSVDFDLDSPAHNVTARIETAGPWYRCETSGPASWSCPVPEAAPVDMNDADTFQVRAY
jgi:hypothetical protein